MWRLSEANRQPTSFRRSAGYQLQYIPSPMEGCEEKKRGARYSAKSGSDSADKWEKPSTSNFPPTFVEFKAILGTDRRDWGSRIDMPHT